MLRQRADGSDLHTIGSTQLVRTLTEQDLADGFRLMIDLVLLGGGKRILQVDGGRRPLRLADGQVISTGAILATYVRPHDTETSDEPPRRTGPRPPRAGLAARAAWRAGLQTTNPSSG